MNEDSAMLLGFGCSINQQNLIKKMVRAVVEKIEICDLSLILWAGKKKKKDLEIFARGH